jgi:hypothetical protein
MANPLVPPVAVTVYATPSLYEPVVKFAVADRVAWLVFEMTMFTVDVASL